MTVKEKPYANRDKSACKFDRTTERRKVHEGKPAPVVSSPGKKKSLLPAMKSVDFLHGPR